MKDDENSDNNGDSTVPLEVDLEKGKTTKTKTGITSTADAGKYDNFLVAVSGRPKFEDECLDNLYSLE